MLARPWVGTYKMMLPTFCVTVFPNFSQTDIGVIEINSVLGIGGSLSISMALTQAGIV